MPSLNLDLNYFEHPKTKRLVGLLGRGAEVLPIKLWSYCGRLHAESGRLTAYSPQEIESIAGWWGRAGEMIDGLLKTGFLETAGDGYKIHAWKEHQGHIVNFHKRAKTAAKARWEQSKGDATSIATSNAQSKAKQCPNYTKRTKPKETRASGPPPSIPFELQSERFAQSWAKWRQYRKEIRKPLTPTMEQAQLAKMREMGEARAVAAMEHTIAMGWTGLREPEPDRKGLGTNGAHPTQRGSITTARVFGET
jgi:hypothetical protein